MVNLILAIIISAAVGFLAGHFSGGGSDPAPVSIKEAVTGEIDAPAPQFNLPRPPSKKAGKPVICEAGKSLQDQLAQLRIAEIQNVCRDAEFEWQKRNVDTRAPFPADERAAEQTLRAAMQDSAVWRGQSQFTAGGKSVQLDIYVKIYVQGPDLCYALYPFYHVDGKAISASNMSACRQNLRHRADVPVFSWERAPEYDLNDFLSALLIPIPGAREGGLEFVDAVSGQWVGAPDFHWKPAAENEIGPVNERHLKKVEDRPR